MKSVLKGILLTVIFLGIITVTNAQVETDTVTYYEDNSVYYENYDENLDDTVVVTKQKATKEVKDTEKKEEELQDPPEKGLYLGLGLGLGATDFHFHNYGINGDNKSGLNKNGHRMRLGGQVQINAAWYFSRHWGISLGVGVSLFRSMGVYNGLNSGNYFNLGDQDLIRTRSGVVDTVPAQIRARLLNWQELESSYFIDIPLMIMYQTKWGKGKHGMYFGVGVKYQQPFQAKYKVLDSKNSSENNSDPDTWRLNISAYHNSWGDMGAVYQDHDNGKWHNGVDYYDIGVGTITNPNSLLDWNGKMSIKGSWTGVAELGFLIGLNRRVDLTLGAYFDYGFNNIEKGKDKDLMAVTNDYYVQYYDASGNATQRPTGSGIEYRGLVNSTQTPKTNLMAVGGKIGLRIKIGKLHCRDPWQEEPEIVKKDTADPLKKLESLLNDLLDNQNQPSTLIIKDPNAQQPIYYQQPPVQNNPYNYNPVTPTALTPQEIAALECCIYFDYAKSDIRPSEVWCLEQKLAILQSHPEIKIKILGNTCDMFGDDINNPLGTRRANAAKQWLMQRGISGDRLITVSQSKYKPQVDNDSEVHRKLNRRDDFEIITY